MDIDLQHVSRKFGSNRHALHQISCSVPSGQIVGLIGPSGAGKSTLLRCISGLCIADPGSGAVSVNGELIQKNGVLDRNIRLRRRNVGFIFQQFNLVDRLNVLTNVLIGNLGRKSARHTLLRLFSRQEKLHAMEALDKVDMADKAFQRASTLSGGEQQRTAIARTYAQRADVILADEPVASLDPVATRSVMEKLVDANRTDGKTVLISLHQVDIALKYCPRIVALSQGRIVYDGLKQDLSPKLLSRIYGTETPEIFDHLFTRSE